MQYGILSFLMVILFVHGHAATTSQSCAWGPDGNMRCVNSNDPSGSATGAFSGINGQNGQVFTSAGGPYGWNGNFGQFGFPGQGFAFGQRMPFFGRR